LTPTEGLVFPDTKTKTRSAREDMMIEEKKGSDEESGFKVTDKRHFTSGGDVVPDAPEAPEVDAAAEGPAPPPAEPSPEETLPREDTPPPEAGPEEKVDFTHLVMSLASSASISMGMMPDPVTGQKGAVNLKAASQMIDLLSVIEEKTKGNLSAQEEEMLKGIMTELRGAFLHVSGFVK
jgi:hypothetical protein